MSGSAVAFSGDGAAVAWIATTSSQQQLMTEPVARDSAATVSVPDPGASLRLLGLNRDGSEVIYDETLADGTAKLLLAQVPSGTPLATGPAASAAVFGSEGASLALLVPSGNGLLVQLATTAGAPSHTAQTVPAQAVGTLNAFVNAQTAGDTAALTSLSSAAVDAARHTPQGLSRGLVVYSIAQPDGTIDATVELLVDPSGTRATALVADETLTLAPAGAGRGYVVTALNVSPLHTQVTGPHVVRLSSAPSAAGLLVQVSFDSDLDAATVPGAISLTAKGGGPGPVPSSVVYDADTRTAWVTLPGVSAGSFTVTVSGAVRDVNGQALVNAFMGTVSA